MKNVKKERKKIVSFAMDSDDYSKVVKLAKKIGLPASALIRMWVMKELNQEGDKHE